MRTARHGTLYRISMLLLALLLAGYLLLPFAVQYVIEQTLRQRGFTDVKLVDVDLEAFAGELRVRGLVAQHDGAPLLALREGYLNIDWLALARRHGLLQGLALHGLELSVRQTADGALVISGLPLPVTQRDADDKAPRWGLGIDRLTVTDSRLDLELPGFKQSLILNELSLADLRSWDAQTPARVRIQARLGDTPIRLEGELTPFGAEAGAALRLHIDGLDLGRLARDLGDRISGDIKVASGVLVADLALNGRLAEASAAFTQRGSLTLRNLAVGVGGESYGVDSATWDGHIDWQTPSELNATGRLTANRLTAGVDGKPQAIDLLDWDGMLRWSDKDGLSSEARLAIHQAQLALLERALTLENLQWQGHAGWTPAAGPGASGRLQADGLEVSQPEQQLMTARAEKLMVPELRLRDGDVVELDGASLDGLALLHDQTRPDAPTRIQAEHVQLGPSRIEGSRSIALGALTLSAATFELERDAPGNLVLTERLKKATRPVQGSDARSPQQALRFALAGLQVGRDSRIAFLDNSVQPPFRQEFVIEEIALGPLDSAVDRWTPLSLAGRLGEYGRLTLSGKTKPLAEKVNVDLVASIRTLDLQQLSAYTAGRLGQNIRSGQLDSDIAFEIIDDQLSGSAKLVAHRLTLKSTAASPSAELTRQLGMSVDAALNMLRDADDNIRLTIPVKGDIREPDFDLTGVLNKAMGKAMQTAALTYVKHALQPYGALITLAQIAGEAAGRVELQPVDFAPGEAPPKADVAPYLEKLTALLAERPRMRIQICAFATERDRQALAAAEAANQTRAAREAERPTATAPAIADQALLALAQQRAANVKRELVERGVAPARLFVCAPEIDPTPDAAPRARLLL